MNHRFVRSSGIKMHIAEDGEGPLVVLCHGYPELWYSWRHQLKALAEAGYHVVAPDQRGYGQTDRPESIDAYTIFHLVGDVIGLLDALGEQQAVVIGHDWGAPVAWHTALFRPDDVRATVRMALFGASGQNPTVPDMIVRPGEHFLGTGIADASVPLPAWVSE